MFFVVTLYQIVYAYSLCRTAAQRLVREDLLVLLALFRAERVVGLGLDVEP